MLENTLNNNLFVGKAFVDIDETESTNIVALDLVSADDAEQGTVVVANHQTNGKGQYGNSWQSDAGKNITISVVLYPTFLNADQQFELNKAICLGIRDFLEPHLKPLGHEVMVKWPNDIMVNGKKIAGVLNTNIIKGDSLNATVSGIGLNVNQTEFTDVPRATSLKRLTERQYNVKELIVELCNAIDARYAQLHNGKSDQISSDYLHALYRYQEPANYKTLYDGEFTGQILGVSPLGMLIVEHDGKLTEYANKEISFLQ